MMPNKGTKVIGLTGTIASGKSTVSQYLRTRYGAVHIDADLVARDVVSGMAAELSRVFGDEILKDGDVDRKALGAIVFADPEKLSQLNHLVHPATCRKIQEMIDALPAGTLAVVEAIELLRTPLKDMADQIWVVYADPQIRLKRLMNSRGLSEEEAKDRIGSQWDDETYLSYADRIIRSNDGSFSELYEQVDQALETLL